MNSVIVKNRVKELRKRLKLRQSDLADEIGVSRQTILAIEKGRLNPSILLSLKIARALGQSADYVFFLASEAETPEAAREAEPPVRPNRPAAAPNPAWELRQA